MVEDKNESENNAGDAEDDTEWLIVDLLDDNGAQLRTHYSISSVLTTKHLYSIHELTAHSSSTLPAFGFLFLLAGVHHSCLQYSYSYYPLTISRDCHVHKRGARRFAVPGMANQPGQQGT